MLSHHSQLETFTHFFPHSSEETKAETQTQAFQKALWPFLNEKWREHREEVVLTIRSFKDRMKPDIYRECVESVKRYINSRDFAVPGRYEVKKSWWFSGIQYYGETEAFHELNELMDKLLAEVLEPKTSCSKTSWSESFWSMGSYVANLFSSALTFATENPGKAMCSVLALETAAVAALSVTYSPYHSSYLHSSDSLHPPHLDSTDSINEEIPTGLFATDLPTTDLFATGAQSSFQPMALADFPFSADLKSTDLKSELISVPHHTIGAYPYTYPRSDIIDMLPRSSVTPRSSITIEEIDEEDLVEEKQEEKENEVAETGSHPVSPFVTQTEIKQSSVEHSSVKKSDYQESRIRISTSEKNDRSDHGLQDLEENLNTDSTSFIPSIGLALGLGSGLSCTHSLALGLMGSLLTQNPLFLGASILFCIDKAYGQIVNGEIPDQLVNVGDNFDLKINMTELFGEPVTDVMISQADGSALPAWLTAGPMVIGSIVTSNANGVAISGNIAYLTDGNSGSGSAGLKIIDVSNASQPVLKGSIATVDAVGVAISGNLAYVADYTSIGGLKIIDVSDPSHPVLKGGMAASASGVAIKMNDSLVYLSDYLVGLEIVDVSDSSNPVLKGEITAYQPTRLAISGNLVYLADRLEGLRIIDVSNSTQPALKGIIKLGDANGVVVSGNLAYVACFHGGLNIIDVSNPTHPVLKASLVTTEALDVVINDSLVYLADYMAGLKIIDVSNTTQPILKGSTVTNCARAVSVNGNLAYVADDFGGLKIIDLTSIWEVHGTPIASMQKYNVFISAKNSLLQTVTRSFFVTTDHFPLAIGTLRDQSIMPGKNLAISLNVNSLFQDQDVGDTLSLGIQLTNTNNGVVFHPGFVQLNINFVSVRTFQVDARGLAVRDHLAYVTDWTTGFQIVDVSDPTNPILKSNFPIGAGVAIALSGNFSYVADGRGGLKIVDVSNAAQPVLRGSILASNTDYVFGVAVRSNFAYVADDGAGLKIVDVSNAAQPVLKGSIATTDAQGVAISGNYAYVADSWGGLKIIDVSNATQPILRGSLATTYAYGVTVNGNYAYVADGSGGLKIIDVSDATLPVLRGNIPTTLAMGVTINGNLAYVADQLGGLKSIDVSNVTQPILEGYIATSYAMLVVVDGNLAYVADYTGGLKIIDVANHYQLTIHPEHHDEGNYMVTIIATDPLDAVSNITFALRVEGAPKLIQPLQSQIALIGQPFSYFVPGNAFIDPNNDIITYAAQNAPVFLSFNLNSATFWGIPSDSDKGEYNITIFATDRITVPTPANLNLLVHYAPTLNKPIASQAADIGKPFIFTLDANTFADRDESFHLTYMAMQASRYPLPAWLKFNNQTQTFSGIPPGPSKNTLTLEVMVDDGLQGRVAALFDLVLEHFPRLTQNFSTVYAAIGHSFTFNAFNYFVDIDGDTLQFSANSLGKGLPSGLVFDPLTCRFSGTPDVSDRGSIPITLTASDYYGGSVQTQFNLTVDDYTKIVYATNPSGATVDNRLPVLAGTLLQQTFTAGVSGEFSVHNAFQDPDGDPLIFSADLGGADNWLTLDHNTGLFSGTPSSRDAATYATRRYTIGVTAMDPANKTAAGTFDILLLGPSLTEKILNAIFAIGGVLVGTYGYYQKKYLLWNWCRKSKYKQPDLLVGIGQTGTLYQVNYPSEKIKSIIVTTIRDRRCISRDSCCCNAFKNTDEYNLPGRVTVHLFEWLSYDPEENRFKLIKNGPAEEALHEDIEIQIRGADNRIMEQFTIKVRNKNEVQATVAALSDEPFALQMEEKLFSSSSSSVTQAFTDSSSPMTAFGSSSSSSSSSSAVLMGSMGFFNSNSKQDVSTHSSATTASAISERGSVHSSGTSALRIPLLNAS